MEPSGPRSRKSNRRTSPDPKRRIRFAFLSSAFPLPSEVDGPAGRRSPAGPSCAWAIPTARSGAAARREGIAASESGPHPPWLQVDPRLVLGPAPLEIERSLVRKLLRRLRARPQGHEIERPRHLPQGRGRGRIRTLLRLTAMAAPCAPWPLRCGRLTQSSDTDV